MMKIIPMGWTQYDSVVFCDADMMFVDNFDEVFDIPATVAYTRGPYKKNRCNGGFFVFNPNYGNGKGLLRCWRVPRWPREACVSFNSGSISLHASTWRSSLVPHSETWWKLSCRMLTFVPLFYQEMVWFVPLFYQEVLCFCSSFISRDVFTLC